MSHQVSKVRSPVLRVAVLTAGLSSGEQGGAERFYQGLEDGLLKAGYQVVRIMVPANEGSFEEIEANYNYCEELDLSGFDVVISTKTPTYAVRHPCHIMYLVHTVRVYDDQFNKTFSVSDPLRLKERAKIHSLDSKAMAGVKASFAIGFEVAHRLYRWQGIKPKVLHPPLAVDGFYQGDLGNYFFIPGRLHPWKRLDLIIEAVKRSSFPLRLIIAGIGEAEDQLRRQAQGDSRIEFVGRVTDDELFNYYANALAVPFTPVNEDYGYVTLEAFASAKAVITCTDSGEPLNFVRQGITGLVSLPNAESLCEALEWVYNHPEDAKRMGLAAKASLSKDTWEDVAKRLVAAALADESLEVKTAINTAVMDMQPIDPPVGGGRLRLLGLYHNLGVNFSCNYIGSYDWPGESMRKHRLTDCLQEIDIPLSNAHHEAARQLSIQASGKVVIDLSFSQLAYLSPAYIDTIRQALNEADVVIFSHPWVYPLVAKDLRPRQIVIYDSHNVEGFLRAQLLDTSNIIEEQLLRQVVQDEYQLGCRADVILACSQEDLLRFKRVYDFPAEKMRVIPNGVMVSSHKPPSNNERCDARLKLKIERSQLVAIFIGSAYEPNIEAARFIISELAPRVKSVRFIIAGGVGEVLENPNFENLYITGRLSEEEKLNWLRASSFAINPMFSGSGTNIKMFDFMAMGLPVITTAIGARGIEFSGYKAAAIVDGTAKSFIDAMRLMSNKEQYEEMAKSARLCVEEGYAWENISNLLGLMIESRKNLVGQPAPFFSVVIPSYERHLQLDKLLACLQKQVECDFEVVIVDQSSAPWHGAGKSYGFPLTYYHSPVKGAVRARNTGALLAQGKVIAFTDDDCLPSSLWLANARKYFNDLKVVGVEGCIISDHLDDPVAWRPVTNIGFEGIGFMTANLMVRSEVFQQLGGFDLQFDHPHFREDTDLGWRMQELGDVPYSRDVEVFHPAQSRELERESASARVKFFCKDALLYRKHPERYRKLFELERHYLITSGFQENLKKGFEDIGLAPPDWMLDVLSKNTTLN